MLTELTIKNFAIIDSISISFQSGLTVLSGETGAGKSIIIDAIQLLVGGRGSAEFVRHGEQKAEIEGLFHLEDENHPCIKKANELGIDVEDGMVVLRRDIFQSGKSVCRINGKLVTIAILREIGHTLVDIHSQHENQELLNETKHLSLLDQYGGKEVKKALTEYKNLYGKYEKVLTKLKQLTENERAMAQRLDLIKFQLNEIQQANLQLNEDEKLMEEKRKLNNFERIYDSLQTAYQSLQGEHKGLDWVGLAMNHLEEAASVDPTFKEMEETVTNSFYLLEEVSHTIRNELEFMEFDPDRLNEIEGRINEINQLKRKYGKTIEEILEYGAKIEEEIETLENKEEHVEKIEKQLESIKKDLYVEARELSNIRQKYAGKLTGEIHQELKDLYMDKTVFEVRFFSDYDTFTQNGSDKVEFYLSTNPGEPLKPLSKIASGGEISRIMLALKSIFSKHQGRTAIIFDEVDTGVSGRVAQAIAEKIYRISTDSQVLCISHLPQVAAMGDTHLLIKKEVDKGRTCTSVKVLNDEEKIEEIGRMISGVEITDTTKEHAKELLKMAKEMK